MSGYVSNNSLELSNSSFEDESPTVAMPAAAPAPAPVQQNARPQLNERFMGRRARHPSRIPAGTFSEHFAYPLESREYSYQPPFFQNARPASRLEMGLVRSVNNAIQIGQQGVLVVDDGPSTEVKLMRNPPDLNGNDNYTFIDLIRTPRGYKILLAPANLRYSQWDFYAHTTPVPFVPRPGSIEAASLPASSQLLGGGGSTSGSFITASAPPLSPSSYAAYQLPLPAASAPPLSPSSYAAYQLPLPAASAAPPPTLPPTPRKLQTVNVSPGGRRKLRKTRGKMRKNKTLRRKHSKHMKLTKA
jgi:hypothetical protein